MQTSALWALTRDGLGPVQEANKVGRQGAVKDLREAGKGYESLKTPLCLLLGCERGQSPAEALLPEHENWKEAERNRWHLTEEDSDEGLMLPKVLQK